MSSITLFSQDTSYGGANDMDASSTPHFPASNASSCPPSYSTSSLRRQSSVALSAASKCMPSGFLQRAGSVLSPRPKKTQAQDPLSVAIDSFSIEHKDDMPRPKPTQERRTSTTISSISTTAASWLGLSSTTSPPRTSSYTTRHRSHHNYATSTISEEDEFDSDYASDSDCDSAILSSRLPHLQQDQHDPFLSSSFLTNLPTDSPADLLTIIHNLHAAYTTQSATLSTTQTDLSIALDELEEARERTRKMRMRVSELEREVKTQESCVRELVAERSAAGRAIVPALGSPPPLSPSLSISSGSADAISPIASIFSSPITGGRERRLSRAESAASSLPEEDDVFGGLDGRGLGMGLGMGMGMSMWEENTRLKARVCELEEVVEGVLGLVESPRL